MMFLFFIFSLHFYTKIDYQYIRSVENLKSRLFLYTLPTFTYTFSTSDTFFK